MDSVHVKVHVTQTTPDREEMLQTVRGFNGGLRRAYERVMAHIAETPEGAGLTIDRLMWYAIQGGMDLSAQIAMEDFLQEADDAHHGC
jgi:hypothetical protein